MDQRLTAAPISPRTLLYQIAADPNMPARQADVEVLARSHFDAHPPAHAEALCGRLVHGMQAAFSAQQSCKDLPPSWRERVFAPTQSAVQLAAYERSCPQPVGRAEPLQRPQSPAPMPMDFASFWEACQSEKADRLAAEKIKPQTEKLLDLKRLKDTLSLSPGIGRALDAYLRVRASLLPDLSGATVQLCDDGQYQVVGHLSQDTRARLGDFAILRGGLRLVIGNELRWGERPSHHAF